MYLRIIFTEMSHLKMINKIQKYFKNLLSFLCLISVHLKDKIFSLWCVKLRKYTLLIFKPTYVVSLYVLTLYCIFVCSFALKTHQNSRFGWAQIFLLEDIFGTLDPIDQQNLKIKGLITYYNL